MSSASKYSVSGEVFETSEEAIAAAANIIKVLEPSDDLLPGTYIKGLPRWYFIDGEKQYYDGNTLWKKVK